MSIRRTAEASFDLEQISLHIRRDNADAALKTVRNIFQRIEQLETSPRMGRVGRNAGTRELVLAVASG
jgi:plasmid stabilization system protein ParE